MIKLYDGKLTDLLQNHMARDPVVQALSYAVLMEKRRIMDMADGTRTMTMIDELPESMLDVLAKECKVDWWEPTCTPEEKRRILKSVWKVHWTLGTKAAVETALSAVYPNTEVREWFEYGGEPYHFKIILDAEVVNDAERASEHFQKVIQLVRYYQNLRSCLDGVFYQITANSAVVYVGAGASAQIYRQIQSEAASAEEALE